MKSRKKTKTPRFPKKAAVATAVLLVTALLWNPFAVPRILDYLVRQTGDGGGDGGGGGSSENGTPLMEGSLGMMGLVDRLGGAAPGNNSTFNPFNLTLSDFYLSWRNITLYSNGTAMDESGRVLMEQNRGEENATTKKEKPKKTFPLFGVEKRPYEVWSDTLNRTVTANFIGESEVRGRPVYLYESRAEHEPVNGNGGGSGGFFGSEGGGEAFAGETVRYYLDPSTSIPLDMRMGLSFSFTFPDMHLLMVEPSNTTNRTEGDLWVRNETIPGKYDRKQVVIEQHTLTNLSPANPEIALFDVWSVYYDAGTGQPLPPDQQPAPERYAVNRRTFQYEPAYGNSPRAGYYTFPWGRLEMRDYPMWDEAAQVPGTTRFAGAVHRWNATLFEYRLESRGVVYQDANGFLPIYRHPGTVYLMDSTTTYQVEATSGLFAYLNLTGRVYVRNAGPVSVYEQTVATFNFSLPENLTALLLSFAHLLGDVLLPLSGKEVEAFVLRIGFADAMVVRMLDAARMVGTVLALLRVWIPLALVLSALPCGLYAVFRARRWRESTSASPPPPSPRSPRTPSR